MQADEAPNTAAYDRLALDSRCVVCGPDFSRHTNAEHRIARGEPMCFAPSGHGPVCVGRKEHWQKHLANTPHGWIEW